MFTLKLTRIVILFFLFLSLVCLSVCLSVSLLRWPCVLTGYQNPIPNFSFSISAFLLAHLISEDEVRQYCWSLIRTVWPNASTSVEDRFWLDAFVEGDKSKSTLQRYPWKFRLVFMGQWAQCAVGADAVSLMSKWPRLAGRTVLTHWLLHVDIAVLGVRQNCAPFLSWWFTSTETIKLIRDESVPHTLTPSRRHHGHRVRQDFTHFNWQYSV